MFAYYIIHNLDQKRYNNMVSLLKSNGVDSKEVKFINHPNKNELTYEIKKKAVQKNSQIRDGWISCSYKHYLALEDIVKNQHELGVIMEDNIGGFFENIPKRLKKYLDFMDDDWDVIFDSVWGNYKDMNEEKVVGEKLVYKKSNQITKNMNGKIISHGSTRAAQFYLINQKAAKKLYDNFLPFNHSADMWMNEVIRKTNLNVYWSEPSLVTSKFNKKTSTKLTFSQFFYGIKSKSINKKLGI
tara:strand:- start:6251 stop:6976 length:726 start_codon:yes stop_codon:yes gene_type:complete